MKKKRKEPKRQDDLNFYKDGNFITRSLSYSLGRAISSPSNQSELEVLHDVLSLYCEEIENQLASKPISEISRLIAEGTEILAKETTISLKKPDIYFKHYIPGDHQLKYKKKYASLQMAVHNTQFFINKAYLAFHDDEEVINFLKEHWDHYIIVASGKWLIDDLKESGEYDNLFSVLLCITTLIKLDMMKLYSLFRSEEYRDACEYQIRSDQGGKFWHDVKSLKETAFNEAWSLWKQGDIRLHDKMAKHLVESYNAPIIDYYSELLGEKYPLKDSDSEQRVLYDAELKKALRTKIVTYDSIKKVIFPLAVQLGRANDPRKRGKQTNSSR